MFILHHTYIHIYIHTPSSNSVGMEMCAESIVKDPHPLSTGDVGERCTKLFDHVVDNSKMRKRNWQQNDQVHLPLIPLTGGITGSHVLLTTKYWLGLACLTNQISQDHIFCLSLHTEMTFLDQLQSYVKKIPMVSSITVGVDSAAQISPCH